MFDAAQALVEHQRTVNSQMADRARLIVETTHRVYGSSHHSEWNEWFALEVGSLLGLTRRSAEIEVDLAAQVVERFPAIWEAMHAGDLDWARAKVLVSGVDHLPDDRAALIVERVLPYAPRLTTGQLAARIRKACLEFDPQDAKRRYERSIEDRRIWIWPHNDGTGDLVASHLPPDRLNRAFDHVDRLARSLADNRTIDQERADVFLDLLTGRLSSDVSPAIEVSVDLETLLGLADRAPEIPGWGHVVTDIARRALEERDGRMRVKVYDEDSVVDVTARAPSAAQRRSIRHRHPTCVFPGCRRPATRSDLDHGVRHVDGGPTHTSNLAPLCRFHHRAKDEGSWSYRIDADRTVVWTSPLGRTYEVAARAP